MTDIFCAFLVWISLFEIKNLRTCIADDVDIGVVNACHTINLPFSTLMFIKYNIPTDHKLIIRKI